MVALRKTPILCSLEVLHGIIKIQHPGTLPLGHPFTLCTTGKTQSWHTRRGTSRDPRDLSEWVWVSIPSERGIGVNELQRSWKEVLGDLRWLMRVSLCSHLRKVLIQRDLDLWDSRIQGVDGLQTRDLMQLQDGGAVNGAEWWDL